MSKSKKSADVDRIVAVIAEKFNTFGGGRTLGEEYNPIVTWMKEKPAVFALGVDVREVVIAVIEEAGA